MIVNSNSYYMTFMVFSPLTCNIILTRPDHNRHHTACTQWNSYAMQKPLHATLLLKIESQACFQGDLKPLVIIPICVHNSIEVMYDTFSHNRLLRMAMSLHLSKSSGRWRLGLLHYWIHVEWQWNIGWNILWLSWHSVAFIKGRIWWIYSSMKEQVM